MYETWSQGSKMDPSGAAKYVYLFLGRILLQRYGMERGVLHT